MNIQKLQKQIESILFISTKPLTKKRLLSLLKKNNTEKIKETDFDKAMKNILDQYDPEKSGLVVDIIDDAYQFVTNSENTELVKSFVKDEFTGELSTPSLETLAIIGYKGPIAKPTIDHIRGVNSSLIIRNLLIRGLINEVKGPEKEVQYYEISFDFLRYLGLNKKTDLPDFERLNKLDVFDKLLKSK